MFTFSSCWFWHRMRGDKPACCLGERARRARVQASGENTQHAAVWEGNGRGGLERSHRPGRTSRTEPTVGQKTHWEKHKTRVPSAAATVLHPRHFLNSLSAGVCGRGRKAMCSRHCFMGHRRRQPGRKDTSLSPKKNMISLVLSFET